MAVTKSEGDGEHPASHYLVVEDPEKPTTWHLRVKGTDGKPDHGLMGAAAAALGKGYRGNKYEGPNKSEAVSKLRALYKSEDMEYPGDGEADHSAIVTRRGPIFKLGDYPDKEFSLDSREAAAAVRAFQPVPIDSEHHESVFDGRLGRLDRVELKGDTIHGEMSVPRWLHDLFNGEPIPVSATWSRQDKHLVGLALAKHPRVTEAAMMTALFARHDTPEGQQLHQQIHDMTARAGAVCNRAEMHSAHERTGLQNIHDETVKHGAQCSADDGKADGPSYYTKESPMSNWKEFWSAFWTSAPTSPALEAAAFNVKGEVLETLKPAAESAELVAMRAELAKVKAQQIATEAAAFADRQIAAKRALPAEREAMVAAFTQAALDDAAHGVVTFADGKTSTRVAGLEAVFAARPAHQWTEELVKDGIATLSMDRKIKDGSPERIKALMGMTATGQAALKARKN